MSDIAVSDRSSRAYRCDELADQINATQLRVERGQIACRTSSDSDDPEQEILWCQLASSKQI